MMDIMELRENENFHTENLPRFMRLVTTQAEKLQVEQILTPIHMERVEKTHTFN